MGVAPGKPHNAAQPITCFLLFLFYSCGLFGGTNTKITAITGVINMREIIEITEIMKITKITEITDDKYER